jgi:hypothetical protein
MMHRGFRATLRRPARLTRVAVALVSTLVAAAACGGDPSTAPATESVVGVYQLRAVAQTALPIEVYRGPFYHEIDGRSYQDFEVTVTGGTLQLDASGGYHTTLNYKALKDGAKEETSLRAWGTYETHGRQIVITRDNGVDDGEGSIADGSVTLLLDIIGKGEVKPYTFVK